MKYFLQCCFALTLTIASAFAPTQAAPSAAVSKGLVWLQGQVQADGSLGNESTALATVYQSRTETLQTLKLLATAPAPLFDVIVTDSEDNTEYLARRVVSISLMGGNVSVPIAQLNALQNFDGGFGGAAAYASHALDTAWALMAYSKAGVSNSTAALNARNYLASIISTDGGMPGSSDMERVINSALSAAALQMVPASTGSLTAINQLTAWLLQQQAVDGSWYQDVPLTALTLLGVNSIATDPTLNATVQNYLLGQQGADGSWSTDPYVTALVLRALSTEPGNVPSLLGAVIGVVLDQAAGVPLQGATVSLSGASAGSAQSASDGRFIIGNLQGGAYTVQVQKPGYSTYSKTLTVTAGQPLDLGNVALSQSTTTGIVRGKVTAAATGLPLASATVSLTGASALSALTDATGQFEFANVAPGAISVSAAATGFVSATGAATLVAGQTLLFSPALYAVGDSSLPTTGNFTGTVIAAGSKAPLLGVTIQLNGVASGSTAADGAFNLVLAPGNYTARIDLAGYDSATANFVLTAGSTVSAGVISLNKQLSVSSIRGRVLDQVTGIGIAGAQVQIIGGATAVTGADGSYALADLSGASFDLRISATGFLSQSLQLQLSRPSDVVQDFALSAQSGAALDLGGLQVIPLSATSRSDIAINTTVTNNGSAPASGVLTLQVVDAAGVVVSQGSAYDASGNMQLGAFTLNATEQLPVILKWNTGQFPPGDYSLVARVSAAGSLTASAPLGLVLASRQGSVAIIGDRHFAGGVTADPPVLQAGLSTTVRLSAVVQNDGNTVLAASDYTLRAIDRKTAAMVLTQIVAGVAMNVGEFQTLVFPDWVPDGSGDYLLEVAATDATLGKLSGTVYVGDAATAQFTLNKQAVPPGTQTVKANVRVTGQDVTLGRISDPLVPLIRSAVQKGVTYGDREASDWVVRNRCLGCHVVTQALVGGELTRNISTYNVTQRDTIYNDLATHLQANGALYASNPELPRTQTMLGAWALNAWHKKNTITDTLYRVSNYLTSAQESSGRWTADHASGWWASPATNTAFNLKSLIDIRTTLDAAPAGSVGAYSAPAFLTGNGISQPFVLNVDALGDVYVSNNNTGTLLRIKPDQSVTTVASGLANPQGTLIEADGTIYVATTTGIRRIAPNGAVTLFSSQGGSRLARGPDGNIYMTDPSANRIWSVTPSGSATVYVAGAPLNSPVGIAFDVSGNMIVANSNGLNILRYAPNKSFSVVVGFTNGSPRSIQNFGQDWLVTTSAGLFKYDAEWHGERWLFQDVIGVAVAPGGNVFVSDTGSSLLRLVKTPVSIAAQDTKIDAAVSRAVSWLLVDSNVNANSNLELAHRLIGLGAARAYYAGQAIASTIQSKMDAVGATLRTRQRADGGWGVATGNSSDSMVTAQVGTALDYLNPSAQDRVVQNAVRYLLSRQQGDGSWLSENGILSTRLAATTWVEIWLPIALDRLGGIDTDVTVALPNNVTLAQPSIAPSASSANTQGGTTYVWKLPSVTSVGRDINFDLTFAELGVGESRAAASDAFLTFNNTFTQSPQNAPIAIPKLLGSAFLDLSVTTDAASYPALSPVVISSLVKNAGLTTNSGSVGLSIYSSSDNVLVADLGSYPFSGLAAGTQVTLPAQWNTVTTAPGPYYVLGTLLDGQGNKAGVSKAAFNITGFGIGNGSGVGAKITADKQSYQPYDLVRLADRISNLTQNQAFDGLTALITVSKPDATVLFTKSVLLGQLLAGANQDLSDTIALSNALAGGYKASLSVLNSAGAQTAYAETFFTVNSSSTTGSGLTGTIFADPKLVPLGDAVLLSSSAVNLGNADLSNVILKTTIVDPLAQAVVIELPETVTLAQQQTYSVSRSWTTQGSVGQTYVAVLTATVAGKTLTLAQDSFTLTEPPVKLDVIQGRLADSRVLVLAACSGSSSSSKDEDEDEDEHNDEHENDEHEDDDRSNGISCASKRVATIEAYLAARNVKRLVTKDENVFRKAMRSGYYNVYWLSGGSVELTNDIEEELAEAVYRGDSLILDNLSGSRAAYVDRVAGTHYHGTLSPRGLRVTTTGVLFPTTIRPSSGMPAYLKLTSGQVQAKFATPSYDREELHDSEDHPSTAGAYPAIVTNQYGAGRAIIYGFDVLTSLQGTAGWNTVFDSALAYLQPPITASLTGGGYVPVLTTITNQARAVDLEVILTAPPGGSIENTLPLATVDATGRPTWRISLAEAAKADLLAGLRLPLTTGTARLTATLNSIRNGQVIPYRDYNISFTVKGGGTRISEVVNGLRALSISNSYDKRYRDSAVYYLNLATPLLNGSSGQLNLALDYLVEAAKYLAKFKTVNVSTYRTNTDLVLQETQFKWFKLQP